MNEARTEEANPFDPDAPFIAQDGLEYEDLAAYILGKPVDCWRNRTIRDFRQKGHSEAAIRQWIKGFDGEDRTPSYRLDLARERTAEVDAKAFRAASEQLLGRCRAGISAAKRIDSSFPDPFAF